MQIQIIWSGLCESMSSSVCETIKNYKVSMATDLAEIIAVKICFNLEAM